VWGSGYGGTERTVDNFMTSLRQKLERTPEKPEHLITVRGMGYRFQP
jgi:DNA-binding response OmpR family regulator